MKKRIVCIVLWSILSVTVMLGLPWLATTFIKSDAAMAVCFVLFYAVNPIYYIIMGVFAGKDIKHLWCLPVITSVLFLLGFWLMTGGIVEAILYVVIYIVLGIIAMFISKRY